MATLAHDERLRLCATLDRVGPDAPTVPEGWVARDLAAHLVWRESLLDLSPARLRALVRGAGLRPSSYAALPWPELVGRLRSGPPRFSPFALQPLDERANIAEFFLHHEDVLRGEPGWSARLVPPDLESALWRQVGSFARLRLRRAPVGLRFRAPGKAPKQVKKQTAKGSVDVIGSPGELLLYASGRQRVAQVELDGRPDAAAALASFSKRSSQGG